MLKKLGKCILVFALLIGTLAPSVVGVFDGNIGVQENRAYANEYEGLFSQSYLVHVNTSDTRATFQPRVIGNNNNLDYNKTNKGATESFILGVFKVNDDGTRGDELPQSEISFGGVLGTTLQYPADSGLRKDFLLYATKLNPSTTTKENKYEVQMYYQSDKGGQKGGINLFQSTNKDYYPFGDPIIFSTTTGNTNKITDPGETDIVLGGPPEKLLAPCWVGFELDIGGCIAWGLYILVWQPSSSLFGLTGKMLDYTMSYTIDSNSYKGMSFVTSGWKLVRDISNIFFILVLIYAGVMTIFLGLKSSGAQRTIFMVIVVGVLINFSLLFSQIIIDTGNILARTIYFNIQPHHNDANKTPVPNESYGGLSYVPFTEAFVAKINPQQLIQHAQNITDTKQVNLNGLTTGNTPPSASLGTGSFILIILLASAINIVGLMVFFSVSLFLIGRVIGLWFAMIFSPLAFISMALPSSFSGKLGSYGFKGWLSNITGLAFMAPVFVFFLYLILLFLDTDFLKINNSGDGGMLNFIMGIIIPFIFIAIMLRMSKDTAKKMAGEIGGQVAGALQTVSGYAVGIGAGAVTGGAALVGRRTLGTWGNNIASSEKLKEKASKGGMSGYFAKMQLKSGEAMSKGSYDARNTKAGGKLSSYFEKEALGGKKLEQTGLGMLNLSSKSGEGGYVGVRSRKIEEYKKDAKRLEVSDDEYNRMKDKIANRAVFAEEKKRKDNKEPVMTTEERIALKTGAIKIAEDTGELKKKETINKERKEEFVKSLKRSAERGPVMTAIGHVYGKGSIDKSAERMAAEKISGDITDKNQKKKEDVIKKKKEINNELQKITGKDENGNPIIDEKTNKEVVGLEEKLEKAFDKANVTLQKIQEELKDPKIMVHGKKDKDGNDDIEANVKEETKIREGALSRADAELLFAQKDPKTSVSKLVDRKEKRDAAQRDLEDIKGLIKRQSDAEKQVEVIEEKRDNMRNKKIDLNSKLDALEDKEGVLNKKEEPKETPKEPVK